MTTHILLPDIHCPYESKPAVKLACQIIAAVKPASVVQLGDFVDFLSVSSFVKPRKQAGLTVRQEVLSGVRCAKQIMAAGGEKTKYVFVAGNHEARIERYLNERPELGDIEGLDFSAALDELGWHTVAYGDHYRLGPNLTITHDFGKASGRAVFDGANVMGTSVAFGHTHAAALTYSSTLDGAQLVCANLGWLGDPKAAEYRQKQLKQVQWQWAVGMVHLSRNGLFHIQIIPFIRKAGKIFACIEGEWLSEKLGRG